MSEDDFDPERMIDAMAPFIGLPVEEEYRAGVVAHLKAARTIAQTVLDFETDDETEPAPVFRA